jgi:hypothetical protein
LRHAVKIVGIEIDTIIPGERAVGNAAWLLKWIDLVIAFKISAQVVYVLLTKYNNILATVAILH